MDPLSVTASIVGILGAATKVSSVLITFVQNTKGAPKLAQTVLAGVNGLSTVPRHLQTYFLGLATSSKSRTSLILVEQVIVTLADCVTTFSELEDVLGTTRLESDLRILDRVKWAMKESKVADIQGRLQNNKSSLTLMLTILSCKANEEAESAMARLCDLVEQVLAENQEMSLRLRHIDNAVNNQVGSTEPEGGRDASITSSGTATPPHGPAKKILGGVQRNNLGFAFEEDLLASRVYRKPLFSKSGDSLVTSAARTTASSILSALSLTDVSNVSILAVPIYAHEISNSARYTFGDFQPDSLAVGDQGGASSPVQQTVKATKRGGLPRVLFGRRVKAAKPDTLREPESKVLGVPLQDLIRYCNIAISLTNEKGESYVYGYIPIFVAKTGVFLKENATDVENIFSISGSPLCLQAAEAAFNNPPRYGKGLDWSGFTVHDAACTLLRFLLRLPESVIPISHYEAFHVSIGTSSQEVESAIRTFQQLVTLLPTLSRQLLLYLLDLLAVFADNSEINKMTAPRLAAIFQPAVLSPVKAGEDFIEETASRQLSQDVLTFLIENQDSFLVGMA